GATSLDVLVTSPGRQAENASTLVRTLTRAAGVQVRVLSAEEEAQLAFTGAVAAMEPTDGLVAVCDMGGASTELAVGLPDGQPSWLRSTDLGALRLTTRCDLGERPGAKKIEAARREAERACAEMLPPLPARALAVGGSARALMKLAGPRLGGAELAAAVELLATSTHGS